MRCHKLLIVALLALASCAKLPDCSSEQVFCAALVTDTMGLDDHGMNQDVWAGLLQAKTDGLADQVEYIESVDARDYEKNIAYFAKRDFDVIVTVNPTMSDETLRLADLYPDSVFVGMNQAFEEVRPNIVPVTFAEDQMGFLAGAMAAQFTKTKVVGAACEDSSFDSMWRYCEGFSAGVLSVNPDIRVIVKYRDDGDSEKLFVDEAWGAESAQYFMRYGADVIFAAGGATGQGALKSAADRGIYAIGTERDQAGALGESSLGVVTSVYGDAQLEVQKVMRLLRDGNIPGAVSGSFKYVPLNAKFPEKISADMDLLLSGLLKGEIKTNVTATKP
jgi:basic membrane protein A